MKARKFKIRPEPSYFHSPHSKHKWRMRGQKTWIINYHQGNRFNLWVEHAGVSAAEIRKSAGWYEVNAESWKKQFPDLPI